MSAEQRPRTVLDTAKREREARLWAAVGNHDIDEIVREAYRLFRQERWPLCDCAREYRARMPVFDISELTE